MINRVALHAFAALLAATEREAKELVRVYGYAEWSNRQLTHADRACAAAKQARVRALHAYLETVGST